MVAARVSSFGGMVPALEDTLIPDNAAATVEDAWLYSGALIGLPTPEELHVLSSISNAKVYRLPELYDRSTYMYNSVWLEFANADTDVIRAPVQDDTYDRYYWASSSAAPRYNTRARIEAADPAWILGIPQPTAPTMGAISGGSGVTEDREYVVTHVSAYGEEGPPSDPVSGSGFKNATWTLNLTDPPLSDQGVDRNLTNTRIYRTLEGTFYLVEEVVGFPATWDDTFGLTDISANGELESTGWSGPPEDLQGFVVMPNGIVASWRENEVWFSEPYRPHAWPRAYVLTVEYPIVGLGVVNQSLVVCTQGRPTTISGTTPANMSESKITNFEPCTGRGSIMSAPEGVYYSSTNGLIRVQHGRAENVISNLVTRDKWQQITGDTRLRAARFGNSYFAYGSVTPGVFEDGVFEPTAFEQEDYTNARNGFVVDFTNERVAFGLLTSDDPVFGVQNDEWSGEVFVLREGIVNWIKQSDPQIPPVVTKWKSKKWQMPMLMNLGAMEIFFDIPPSTPALNPVANTSLSQTLASDQYGLLRLYADDTHVMTRELRKSGELWKLPSGFKADFWQFEIETRVKIKSVSIASTSKELRQV